ncbi:MAG: PEP-CTERM sorting domain-containing protein [Pseudomonadota bacterium]
MTTRLRSLRARLRVALLAALAALVGSAAHATALFDFRWEGQIAGFSVEGQFSFDDMAIPSDGVVRRDDLLSFDVSFFDPDGALLRTYIDNHLTYSEFNFNFDTVSGEILQDGAFNAPDGIDIGEYTVDPDGGASGLNLWSRPPASSVPHLHFDDWDDAFGFPRAFGGHEDVAFFAFTTAELAESPGFNQDFLGRTNFPLDAVGARVSATQIPLPAPVGLLAAGVGLIGWKARKRRAA